VDFIEKPLGKQAFIQKVRSILQGSTPATGGPREPLTRTEMGVLRLIIDGKSNREIADLLHRSVRTVEVHRARIMYKLGAGKLIDLIKLTAAMGLVSPEEEQELQETAPD